MRGLLLPLFILHSADMLDINTGGSGGAPGLMGETGREPIFELGADRSPLQVQLQQRSEVP